MNNDLKSLAQIAAECSVTKQAAYKRVNGSPEILERLQPHTVTSGTRKYYTLRGQAIIKALFTSHQSQPEVNQRSTESQPELTTGNSVNTANVIEESQPEVNQWSTNSQPEVNPRSTESQPTKTDTQSGAGAAAFNAAIEALTAQLNAKDEQLKAAQSNIQDLNKHIEELTNALTCSQEQQRALTEALTAAQQSITAAQALHAGTLQERLTVNEEPEPEPVTVPPNKEHSEGEAPAEPAEEPAPKRSLFARLFKRK